MGYQPQQQYVMLADQGGLRPPPHRRNPPNYDSHNRSESFCSCCCGCICWCCCFLFLLLLLATGLAAYFVYTYKPQAPSYSVNDLSVGAFEFTAKDLTLYTKIVVTVTADNPNEMIGISYGTGSRVVVMYQETTLCSGKLPSFYQGHRNKTVMHIVMEGRHSYGSGLQEALEESQRSGSIPIDVYVTVPVALKLGDFNLNEITVNVLCSLVIDNLAPNKKVSIKSAEYKVNVEF